MKFDIVTTQAALTALLPEWRALQHRSGRGIFTGPEWCEGWWRHLGRDAGFKLHVVTVRRDGKLVGVAPFCVARRKGVRLLQWAGGEVSDYSDFLLEDAADATALWDAIRKSPHYDVARISDMRPEAFCLTTLEGFATQTGTTEAHHIRIEWPTFDGWLAKLPYAARKHYRARVKQAEVIGPLTYEVTRGPVPEASFDTLIAQKTAWYAHQKKSGMLDTPGGALFLRHIAEAEGRAGRLHFSVLRCKDEIIATHLGFIMDGTFYCYLHAYGDKWSALSPGKLMLFKSVGWAIENGCREFDFMRGEEDYKNSLSNGSRTLRHFMFARTLLGKLAWRVYLRSSSRKKRPEAGA